MRKPFIANITFASENPIELAEFWGAALGYVEPDLPPKVLEEVKKEIDAGKLDPTAWAMRVHPEGLGARLLFQRRPKTRTDSIPIHLDISVETAKRRSNDSSRSGRPSSRRSRARSARSSRRARSCATPKGTASASSDGVED